MTLPGTDVVLLDAPRPRSSPTDTGQAFMVGESDRGPATPRRVRSLTEWVQVFGGRQAYSYLYDAAEAFFREGGSILWTSRVVSPTATTATLDLSDGAGTTLTVRAKGPGTYGNALTAEVLTNAQDGSIPVGSFKLRVREAGALVEDSPVFEDRQQALNWSEGGAASVELVGGVNLGDPVAIAATALAGGADNRAAITDAEWTAALDRVGKSLGPGQVLMPGRTTAAAHLALLAHARANARHALLDLPDTSVIGTLTTAVAAAGAAPNNGGRWGSAYWPWAVAPGLTPFSTRIIPWSAVQAGLAARVDALGNPNQPVAGVQHGQSRWVAGLSQPEPTGADREVLNDAGVNVAVGGGDQGVGPMTFGNRTLRSASTDPLWTQASGSRLAMAIAARGDAVLLRYVHAQIDGKGHTQGDLNGQLQAILADLYDRDALFGDTPSEAFAVDTGPAVNTTETIAAGQLRASVAFRASPGADRVTLELVRVAVTEAIA